MQQGPFVDPHFDDEEDAVTEIYSGVSRMGPLPEIPITVTTGSVSDAYAGPFSSTPAPPAATLSPISLDRTEPVAAGSSPPPASRLVDEQPRGRLGVVLGAATAAIAVAAAAIVLLRPAGPADATGVMAPAQAPPQVESDPSSPIQPAEERGVDRPRLATDEAAPLGETTAVGSGHMENAPRVDAPSRADAKGGVSVFDLPAASGQALARSRKLLQRGLAAPPLPANPYLSGSRPQASAPAEPNAAP